MSSLIWVCIDVKSDLSQYFEFRISSLWQLQQNSSGKSIYNNVISFFRISYHSFILHSEWPKFYGVSAILSAIGL